MIHYLFPYSTTKNIGGAYNQAIRNTNCDPNDWIVIKDGDVAFLTPEWGRQIAQVASTTDFALIGCMTGRLRFPTQLHEGKFDAHCDIFKNFDIAVDLESNHWGKVEEVAGIAGMLMMFRWSTWVKVGGFKERDIKADLIFNQAVRGIGGKIGVMIGLYVLHAYRPWEKTQHGAMNSNKHLIG
jgi:glycosyltransferase involved in cell wall biosynthesis